MICQTLDWSEFSNISKLRDVFDRHNCTGDTRQHRCELTDKAHPPPAVHGRVSNMAAILPIKIGVIWIEGVTIFPFVLVNCIQQVMGDIYKKYIYIFNRNYLLGMSFKIVVMAQTGDRFVFLFWKRKFIKGYHFTAKQLSESPDMFFLEQI